MLALCYRIYFTQWNYKLFLYTMVSIRMYIRDTTGEHVDSIKIIFLQPKITSYFKWVTFTLLILYDIIAKDIIKKYLITIIIIFFYIYNICWICRTVKIIINQQSFRYKQKTISSLCYILYFKSLSHCT